MASRVRASSAPNGSSIKRNLRIMHQRTRDRRALTHTARQLVRITVGEAFETDQLQKIARAPPDAAGSLFITSAGTSTFLRMVRHGSMTGL